MKYIISLIFLATMFGQTPAQESPDPTFNENTVQQKFQNMNREERLADAIKFYRSIGFFEEYKNMSDEELFTLLNDKLTQLWSPEYDPFYPENPFAYTDYADLYLLGLDEKRVWLEDLEADVGKGNDVYVETIKRWGYISNGNFTPENIIESWESVDRPAVIEFDLNGKKHKLTAQNYNDFIDIEILNQINPLIKDTGNEFVYIVIDQMTFVACLSEEQQSLIESKRGLLFDNN